MGKCVLTLCLAGLAPLASAASIGGVVVEAITGNPLAHSKIDVTPLTGTPGKAVSLRVDHTGSFNVSALAPGFYTVTASREGFLTAEYGQKRWNSAGAPVSIDDSHPAFLDFRLQRYGAITGAVVDEQDVGILAHEVVAYSARDPQHPLASAFTDDRGIYRVTGLTPGAYLIRTKPKQIEEISYLPTFDRETLLASEAERVTVDLDRATETTHIQPKQGLLVRVAGYVVAAGPRPFQVTFVTDMGRQTKETGGSFSFDPVPPGHYEIYATGPGDGRTFTEGAYMDLDLKNNNAIVVKMLQMHDTTLRVIDKSGVPIRTPGAAPEPVHAAGAARQSSAQRAAQRAEQAAAIDAVTPTVLARRIDLAGVGEPQSFKVPNGYAPARLAPGRWELRCVPPNGYYVTSYMGSRGKFGAVERPDAWHEITIDTSGGATFTLSSGAASIHGTVNYYGEAAAGAPVFLEPYDNAKHERLFDITTVRAGVDGRYIIGNLSPGIYRILSTFDFREPTVEDFDAAGAHIITVDEARQTLLDLDLWGIR